MRCICGCGQARANWHHVVYVQELRHRWKEAGERQQRWLRQDVECHPLAGRYGTLAALLDDKRNLVPVAFDCHGAHHGASRRLSLHRLPDSVFVFASEVLGPEKGYEYLRRRYSGHDLRHERMLLEAVA